MTEFEKALKIVEQINKLDMDQTPLFTWDEMEEVKRKHEKQSDRNALFFLAIGIMVGAVLQTLFLVIK